MPGICAGDQCLSHAAQPMHDSRTLSECGITHGSTIHVNGRLRGGTAGWQLIVKPRIQKDKWSNYWKVSCAIVHTSAWVLYLSSCRPPTTTRSILWDSLWPLLWPLQCEPWSSIQHVQESMETKTDMEPDIHLTVQPTMTVSEVQKEVEKRMGWLPTSQLKRYVRKTRLSRAS